MTEEAPTTDPRYSHPRARDDDARGARPGAATTPQAHGGRIGQAPYQPTEAERAQVRMYAKTFPPTAERYIARLMGFSRDTLRKHFADDLEHGRAEMLAAVGAQVIARALNGKVPEGVTRGELDAQKFILARMGGWSNKVEMSGPDGGPVETRTYDLSNLTDAEKRALLPVLNKVIGDTDEAGSGEAAS